MSREACYCPDMAKRMKTILREARDRAIAAIPGGVSGTKRALKITRFAVQQWQAIPPLRVPAISELSGIPKHELRPDMPDLFPPPRR